MSDITAGGRVRFGSTFDDVALDGLVKVPGRRYCVTHDDVITRAACIGVRGVPQFTPRHGEPCDVVDLYAQPTRLALFDTPTV